jgi:NAD(P)H-nitrite reductase large subunit
VCRCLKVTEEAVIHAIAVLGFRTVKEIRQATGAGDGCTCCHKLLARLIERHGAPEQPELAVAGHSAGSILPVVPV